MTCDWCSKDLVGGTKRRRYCDSGCRTAATRARAKGLPAPVDLTARRESTSPAAPAGTVAAATLKELEDAGRADTAMGRAALALAARIDLAADTGTALAGAVRTLQQTLEAATAGAQTTQSSVDELRARRDAKRHA